MSWRVQQCYVLLPASISNLLVGELTTSICLDSHNSGACDLMQIAIITHSQCFFQRCCCTHRILLRHRHKEKVVDFSLVAAATKQYL